MPTPADLEAVARGAPRRRRCERTTTTASAPRGPWSRPRSLRRTPLYGVTTGFGQLASVRVEPADAARLQVNLLRSHAVGAGPPLEADVVRGMLLLLASSLRRGHSGVRVELVEKGLVLGMLDRGGSPVVPSRGCRSAPPATSRRWLTSGWC